MLHMFISLVIDEFDKCLEMGFQEEMSEVIVQIPYLKRRFLLSRPQMRRLFLGLYQREIFEIEFLGR